MSGANKCAAVVRAMIVVRIVIGLATILSRASTVVCLETSQAPFAFGILQQRHHRSVTTACRCHKRVHTACGKQKPFHGSSRNCDESFQHESSNAVRSRNTKLYQRRPPDDADVGGGNIRSRGASSDDDLVAPNFWRTTPGGLRIVDDEVGTGDEWLGGGETTGGAVVAARVRCETQILQSASSSVYGQQERVIFLEPSATSDDGSLILSRDASGVTLLVAGTNEKLTPPRTLSAGRPSTSKTTTNTTNDDTIASTSSQYSSSGWQESLIGMRVGGRRRVLIPTTTTATTTVRFVGPGATSVTTNEPVVMTLRLESLEPLSGWRAILASKSGLPSAVLSIVRPVWSPLGLLALIGFAPLIIKKTINAFAALELYMDVNADSVYPIKTLLEWKLKF